MEKHINNKGNYYNSFIYIWYDFYKDKFYLGSHYGSEEDGYLFGGIDIKTEYKKRPNDFTRDIISYHLVNEYYEIREIEKSYLIKYDVENNEYFYNRTNESYGGYHKKSVERRLNDIDENGLNHFQRASLKMVKTRQENGSYKTSKIKEYETKKSNIEKLENTKNKISETLKGSKWINKSGNVKYIKDNEVEKYLNDGWIIGRYNTKTLNEYSEIAILNNIKNAKQWYEYAFNHNLQIYVEKLEGWVNWYKFLGKEKKYVKNH